MKGIFPNNEKRERLADGIIGWIENNLERFDPPQEELLSGAYPEHDSDFAQRKAFCELGTALRLAYRTPRLRRRPDIKRVVDYWVTTAYSHNIFFDARRRHHNLPFYFAFYSALAALDTVPVGVRASLQILLNRGFLCGVERSAWNKLDLVYYLEEAGFSHTLPANDRLVMHTNLASPSPLPYVRQADLYAMTHVLFDLSKFCAADPVPVLASIFENTREYIAAALAMCIYERDWDLSAELLINRMALGDVRDTLNLSATDAICEAQQPSGFIPDTAWLSGLPFSGDSLLDRQIEFSAIYHPTVVCLFLLACEGSILGE